MIQEITVTELKSKMDENADFQLIDVREAEENGFSNIGGEHIPMGEIIYAEDKISKEKPVYIYCRSGNRSMQVLMQLATMYGFDNLYNVKGGVIAWSQEVDSSFEVYGG